MLLAFAFAAFASQTATDPRAAERGCIIEGLVPDQRVNLAEQFIVGEMQMVETIAQGSAVKCAAKWKWPDGIRDWNIVHSAAYAAMVTLESRLPDALGSAQLEALFNKLDKADQYGLTNEGAEKLGTDAYTALIRRAGALLVAEKLAPADVETAGNWFVAYAQFIESDAYLKALAKPK
jgi:hypothetical protein